MIYTPKEYQKIKEVLNAFQEYIEESYTFEIIYSTKMGFLWLDILPYETGFYRMETAETLLHNLYWDIYTKTNGGQYDENQKREEAEKQIKYYLKHIPEESRYHPGLDAFLRNPTQSENIPHRKKLVLR